MPLPIKSVKETPVDELYVSNSSILKFILDFLKKNHENAFTPKEIRIAIQDNEQLILSRKHLQLILSRKHLNSPSIGISTVNNTLIKYCKTKSVNIHKKASYYWYEEKK